MQANNYARCYLIVIDSSRFKYQEYAAPVLKLLVKNFKLNCVEVRRNNIAGVIFIIILMFWQYQQFSA